MPCLRESGIKLNLALEFGTQWYEIRNPMVRNPESINQMESEIEIHLIGINVSESRVIVLETKIHGPASRVILESMPWNQEYDGVLDSFILDEESSY